MDRFERIFDYLLRVEGGYSDDKHDKGGKTKYGIIEEEARDFGYKGDMQDLTIDFAKNIYLKKYYLGNKLDKVVNDKVALSICDWAVNSGRNGTKNAQIAINQLTNANLDVDGIIGNKTLEALNSVDPEKFLEVYHNLQRIYYKGLVEADNTQEKFFLGWMNRIESKEKYLRDWDKENTENRKYYFAQSSLDKMKKIHPRLVEVMKVAIENSPFDFRITDGARTAEEQFALYQIGRSKPGRIVTNCDGKRAKSNHQIKADGYGHAVDIFPCGVIENGVYRKFTSNEGYDDKKLRLIANHILAVAKSKNINVEWGGNWKMHDTPHFELK
ncbi:glycosyl hydrolase 108 family protein [Leptotrichia sp. oral taxon 223]|uniref:glycosyl hydrolase 108 family protein n=1 Tax=Leptotrichia sp. oral taxon 223 TaxID=712363 RepID=UPI0015B9066F|nr:glycosyl hydrolase 108 family protein [Leptotrichia sp. oral taxon 223]NWO18818.1 M15 family metallopeptidase [Leptotrichia sp. oral taxon 223]